MTDLEINKALAMAIGWGAFDLRSLDGAGLWVYGGAAFVRQGEAAWRMFDYRDSAVIWPIAERYNKFPNKFEDGKGVYWQCWFGWVANEYADTAAKAVALSVIGATK